MTVETGLMQQVGSENRSDASGASDVLAAVVGALYDLHCHRDASTLGQKILTVVPRMIACDSAVWVRIEPAALSFTFSSWPADRFDAVDHKEAATLHLQDHPLVAHFATGRDARAWSPYDFVPRAVFRRTMLYRKLYRPPGIEFQLALLLPYPDHAPRVLALHRRGAPFSEEDRQLLGLLWPHLTQAVRTSRATARQRGLPEIDALPAGRGVVLLDRAGKVELCTEQARIWLTRYCMEGFTQRETRSLPAPIAGWVAGALRDRALQSRGIADPHAPLILRRGDQYLAMRLVADHGRGQHLVLMDEMSMHAPPDLLLGQGLTPREAEVLAWVAQGKTNRETGVILGMSTRTVQKHLERIFTKLGVETRTGAILKAWQIGRYQDLGARTKAMRTDRD